MIKEAVFLAVFLLLWQNVAESLDISQIVAVSSSKHSSPGASTTTNLTAFTTTATTTTTTSGNLYRLFEENKNFAEAKEACVAKGGHLVTILSEDDQANVEMTLGDTGEKAWIGLEQTGRWEYTWVNGDVVTLDSGTGAATAGYSNFYASAEEWDQTDYDAENCVFVFGDDYTWGDNPCSERRDFYICKMVPL